MLVACQNCGHQLDPNADDSIVSPPINQRTDLFSIVCPNCNQRRDFTDWKQLTARTRAS